MKKLFQTGLPWIFVTLAVLTIDRFSKWWIVNHLEPYVPQQVLPVFNLTLAYNKGAAFSFLGHASGWQNLFLGSLAVIVSAIIIIWLYRQPVRAYWNNIALSLILGGALGNAWDRVLYGYVIDYFDFHLNDWHFAIFNAADSAICVGAFMLIVNWIFLVEKKI